MPIFKYKCAGCENEFEYLILAGRDEEVRCPSCGNAEVEKQFTVFSKPKNSRSSGKNAEGTCCGMSNQCDSPKRCCES